MRRGPTFPTLAPMSARDAKYFGVHACAAIAAVRPNAIHRAFFSEEIAGRFGELMRVLAASRKPYRVIDDEELEKVSGTRHHEGVCLIADVLPEPDERALVKDIVAHDRPARFLFLDGVGNPHNVGAVLRTAAHFGASAITGPLTEIQPPSGAAARIAQGGAEHVPVIRWRDPKYSLERLRDHGFIRVATVVAHGQSLFEVELPRRCVFLIGAERQGLSDSALSIADIGVTIPGTGDVESLNVANASAILLAEHYRRFGV